MLRYQQRVYDQVVTYLDPTARQGTSIHSLKLTLPLFDANPQSHAGPISGTLQELLQKLTVAARADGRLALDAPLVRGWTLAYDIYSPKLRRFIEVDERQHFSRPRLQRIQLGRAVAGHALYPAFFWHQAIERVLTNPARDLDPPHRDEARAYRDEVRELLPLAYGLAPTIRLDQWSLDNSGSAWELIQEVLQSSGGAT